jgi:hypothetical protein
MCGGHLAAVASGGHLVAAVVDRSGSGSYDDGLPVMTTMTALASFEGATTITKTIVMVSANICTGVMVSISELTTIVLFYLIL